MGERVRDELTGLGLQVQWQEVEEGRPNVIGILEGAGGGKSLMFNGHMDTSYSGQEPWLAGIRGFQPEGFVQDGRVYGLGISNMKGALASYVEAVRALQDAGTRLRGDVLIAAVAGEIEKTQWHPDYEGREYRGYAAGSRFLASHGGVADMCILGEPTEQKVVLGHYGAIWMRISTTGPFIHTAFSEGRRGETSVVRMRDVLEAVLEFAPEWEERTSYGGKPGIVNVGAINGGFPWRVSRTPHRTDLFVDFRVPPTMPMAEARAALGDFVRQLRERFPEHGIEHEIYVTAPGSEIAEDHALIEAIDEAHEDVFGAKPERDTVRWFSDASALTRYGIESVNYGTSSGLPDPVLGENLDIDGLVKTAKVYALVAQRICEPA
jgi:acetylornithine deacetylase